MSIKGEALGKEWGEIEGGGLSQSRNAGVYPSIHYLEKPSDT